jgi:hypothetical protein
MRQDSYSALSTQTLEVTDKIDGNATDTQQLTLSPDLKTLTSRCVQRAAAIRTSWSSNANSSVCGRRR